MKVTKAVIPAAGLGTRFLPQTKAMPKEMLPIVDKPVIQYVVEELVASGITDIIIVTGWHKRAIEDHFDYPNELIHSLEEQGKEDLIKKVKETAELANFIYIRQKGHYGNGTPVLCAKSIIGDEPFVTIWGDEFIYATPPRTKQCIDAFNEYGHPVLSAIRVPPSDISRYGIAETTPIKGNISQITNFIEKPAIGETKSNLAAHGCYVLTPDIFEALENLEPGKNNEVWLVDAIFKNLAKTHPIYACEIENGEYFDTGNKLEYLKAVVKFSLKDKVIGPKFAEFLKNVHA